MDKDCIVRNVTLNVGDTVKVVKFKGGYETWANRTGKIVTDGQPHSPGIILVELFDDNKILALFEWRLRKIHVQV